MLFFTSMFIFLFLNVWYGAEIWHTVKCEYNLQLITSSLAPRPTIGSGYSLFVRP